MKAAEELIKVLKEIAGAISGKSENNNNGEVGGKLAITDAPIGILCEEQYYSIDEFLSDIFIENPTQEDILALQTKYFNKNFNFVYKNEPSWKNLYMIINNNGEFVFEFGNPTLGITGLPVGYILNRNGNLPAPK